MSGGEGVRNPADINPILEILGTMDDTDILAFLAIIEAVTSALPTLSETGGTVTTDGTEQNVYVNANPLGEFNPISVTINCTNQTAGETIVLRLYYDNAPGGAGLILVDEVTYVGLIDPPMLVIDLDPNRYGVAVTIERTAGAARNYPWDVHYEI
jgi:hypothetical protein